MRIRGRSEFSRILLQNDSLGILANPATERVAGNSYEFPYESGTTLRLSAPWDAVPVIDQHDPGGVRLAFFIRVLCIAADDHKVADMNQARGSAVETHDTGTSLAADGVRCEAIAIVDVVDINLFPFDNVGCFHQQRVQRDAAFVVQAGIRDSRTMDFGFEQDSFHSASGSQSRGQLSFTTGNDFFHHRIDLFSR